MAAVLTPSVTELEDERNRLLASQAASEDELRRRAEAYMVTPEEARVLRRLDQIAYLLGEDEG